MRRLPALRLALASALAVTLAGAAGCTRSTPPGDFGGTGQPGATSDSGQGGLGTGGNTGESPGGNDGGNGATTGAPATYPNDARNYAMAAITAWVNGQTSRLASLTGPGAATNFANISGHPDTHWQYYQCEGAAGSLYCSFRNNNGDQLQLRVSSQYLGQQHAVSEVVYEKTEYGTSAESYVSNFILAWTNGNKQRMVAYANQQTVDLVTKSPPPENWTAQNNAPPPSGGYTYVFETSTLGTFSMTFKVLNSAFGKQHAIQCAKAGNATC
jgi:hypothetical protein